MENLEIGKLHKEEQHRDAVHMAIAPFEAGRKIMPGQRIRVVEGKAVPARAGQQSIGIADPFLEVPVSPGDKFWIFLYPGSITSLRHEWTHPAFECKETTHSEQDRETADRVAKRLMEITPSQQWITEYAERVGVTYEQMMEHAKDHADHGSYWVEGGRFEGESIPEGFWDHYEKITGEEVDKSNRDNFFSCSC